MGIRAAVSIVLSIGLFAGAATGAAAQPDAPDGSDADPRLSEGLPYGEDPRQVLYAYELEPREAPRPAVVHFHGGGLVEGEPLEDAEWAMPLAEQGYVTFLAGYRLFDEATGSDPWPAQLEDAQRAVQWVRDHAEAFGVDPARVCATGFSSGGLLASMVGITDAALASDDEASAGTSSRVDCVVTLAGDNDYTVPYAYPPFTEVVNALLGGTVEDVPERWTAASPAHNVDAQTVPFLIVHGNRDTANPIQMSRNLAAALGEAGREYVYAEVIATHDGVRVHEVTRRLMQAYLAAQLRPDE
jgi:acetyl esterase/lipase